MGVSISVHDDLETLGRATRDKLSGPVVAVSGGSTYEAILSRWTGLSGAGLSFLPVDERRVGLSQSGSNWMVAIRLLLDPNGLSEQALHWAPDASRLETLVRRLVPGPEDRMPSLPQVWLGMGDDGHTASLFPNGLELFDRTSVALETVAPKAPHLRATLGLGAIRAAKDLCVVVTGEAKGRMLRRVLDGDLALPLALALDGRDAALFVDAACARAAGI